MRKRFRKIVELYYPVADLWFSARGALTNKKAYFSPELPKKIKQKRCRLQGYFRPSESEIAWNLSLLLSLSNTTLSCNHIEQRWKWKHYRFRKIIELYYPVADLWFTQEGHPPIRRPIFGQNCQKKLHNIKAISVCRTLGRAGFLHFAFANIVIYHLD